MAVSDERLSERERQVLQALVDAHIAQGEPIGSKAIAALGSLGVSPATIRNVLAALDGRGMLEQPHTSAGRVPTDRGLRYYVDSLLQYTPPPTEVQDAIASRIEDAGGVDQALREGSRLLSRLVKHTCVVLATPGAIEKVRHVELVRLRDDAILFILVTADGRVQNRLLDWKEGTPAPSQLELDRASRRICDLLQDRTLEEGRRLLDQEIAAARLELRAVEERLLALSKKGVDAVSPESGVHIDGTSHLLDALADEPSTRHRSQQLLQLLEEQERLREIFEVTGGAPGIRIFIGGENPDAALADLSMVTATVGAGRPVGVLGVIGPRHLDYGRVVPLVDITARLISGILS